MKSSLEVASDSFESTPMKNSGMLMKLAKFIDIKGDVGTSMLQVLKGAKCVVVK